MDDLNLDSGQIDTAAIALNEAYSAYLRAGFSEEQAFRLVLAHVSAAVGGGGDD